jgi:large subunit ribosomal protein L29
MRVDEMRALADADLVQQRDRMKEEAMRLRFAIATNQETNNAQMRRVKRDIARINTILREREIAAAYEAALTETSSQ